MRVCLVSRSYPPHGSEGIARQRQVLAAALAKKGHEVHVITQGVRDRVRSENGVFVHEIPTVDHANPFSARFPGLNEPLTYSQAAYECLLRLEQQMPVDVVDVPLWMAEGLIMVEHFPGPTVVWLQTTLSQMVELQSRRSTPQEVALVGLEKECLDKAAGVIADSDSILTSVERLYGFRREAKPTRVIPLGLPPLPEPCQFQIPRPERPFVEALVVGRLEFRKGTQVLFDILPQVLHQEKRLRVRFVGRDNSASDGFHKQTGMSYPEYFRQYFPDLRDRVIFEGYVSEERLPAYYLEADFMLLPSLYESFGLVFLEGMRCGLPVVTFAAGGACEIFAQGQKDGAVLISVGDSDGLADAIVRLARDRDMRAELGQCALARFMSSFQDSRMAQDTVDFYAHVCQVHQPPRRDLRAKRVFQVMEALDYGDAVSNIATLNAEVLAELGGERAVLSLHADPRVRDKTKRLNASAVHPDDAIIFHYWNYSQLEGFIRTFRGPKAIHYHNITPPHYFSPQSVCFQTTASGYEQLHRIANCFDLIIGDSNYNLSEYARFLSRPKPTICIHPSVETEALLSAPFDEALYRQLREEGLVNFLFVGRVARNKRQDQVMRVFDYYYREINRYSRLFLVGDFQNPDYFQELEGLRQGMMSHEQIVFTGKVSNEAMRAYYRAADVFVCASEHEGFCVPIVEAMAYGIPVVAFAAAAVPETLGRSGVLIHQWDVARVAELINLLLKDQSWRASMIEGQKRNLQRFSVEEARQRLAAVVDFLREGKESPFFVWRGPDSAGYETPARPGEMMKGQAGWSVQGEGG